MRPVPQIQETGVSADYFNEYAHRIISFDIGGIGRVAISFQENPVKKYEERFSSNKYTDIITDTNRDSVKQLDDIAMEANQRFCNANEFMDVDFKRLINAVRDLIYGIESPDCYPEVRELAE